MYAPTLVLFSVILTELVLGERTGAPQQSCKTMTPGHRGTFIPLIPRQKQPSGYSLDAKLEKSLKMVRVTVSGKALKGFLIQGRWSEDGPAVGSFLNITEDLGVKYQNCSDFKFHPESSVTHTNDSEKDNLVFYWQPPKTMNKEKTITFFATLAQTKERFWVMQASNPLNLAVLEDDTFLATRPPSKGVEQNEKPTTTRPPSEGTKQNTIEIVVSSSTPTENKGPKAASSGISLISIMLVIAMRMALEI
ncbi:putative defense protein [Dendronephthya gigantea]|uniref:putative defense protein n=1 Tax=Dendronephthya gigantea TaxID=151771 RepID=UPI001069215D|nr:putative defense protein [Dendronephthya gigantea]XP_028418461.1 putative defense protein [Dendronephthya gigantea]